MEYSQKKTEDFEKNGLIMIDLLTKLKALSMPDKL